MNECNIVFDSKYYIDYMPPKNTDKKTKGQFYTVNSNYILEGLPKTPPPGARCIIEPFAGKGDLLNWMEPGLPVETYDIDPQVAGITQRDTLLDPPNYADTWIITNPPYLARNKCDNKRVFDRYDTNDLYKCFITSLTAQPEPCMGGILIIPAGFFLSPRPLDVRCRDDFMAKYKITCVKYFEETVFPDTATTVVAFSFEKSSVAGALIEQSVPWISMPSRREHTFVMTKENSWIIGGEIYRLPVPDNIRIKRYVEGQTTQQGEQITNILLHALDSGTQAGGRVCLEYREGYIYPAKDCSRTYATLCIQGRTLTVDEQRKICEEFNSLIEKKREDTWSLFLPQYRESKEYARKRIPFELAYSIVLHIIGRW